MSLLLFNIFFQKGLFVIFLFPPVGVGLVCVFVSVSVVIGRDIKISEALLVILDAEIK